MPLSKCPRCEELFDKTTSLVCVGCVEDEERDHETVRDLISEHSELSAEGVAELSGVDLKCVLRMLDTGKIASIQLGEEVECGRCGAPAISAAKRLCESCLEKLNQEMNKTKKSIQIAGKKRVEVGGYTNSSDGYTSSSDRVSKRRER